MAVVRFKSTPDDQRITETVVLGDGRQVHYVARGHGQPVVLVHGLGGSWRWWRYNIDAFARHYRVYALDLSRRERWLTDSGRVRPQEAADVLAEWLAHTQIARTHIVGHSLGGHMAVRLAATFPELVDRLVLVNAAGLPFDVGLLRLTARAILPAPDRSREFRRLVMIDAMRANPLRVLRTAREMLRDDVTDLLGRVSAPTLIVWGGRDHVVPLANAYALEAGIPGARLVMLPHSGHNPMYHHAGTFNRLVLEFLAGG